MTRSIGQTVDSLGVTSSTAEEGELVDGAIVILRTIRPEGGVTLRSCWSDGLDWVTRLGMLAAATDAERKWDGEEPR